MKQAFEKVFLFLLPGLGDILWISAFISVIGMGPRMMNIDGDLGRHLTIGAYILAHGRVPTADLFSHTMYGQPLTPHEWLSQVIFALANRVMGLDGVILVCALVIATSFWLVYRRARQSSRGLLTAVFFAVLAMAAASLHWLSRPHVFTFLMLALWMCVLDDLRQGRLRRWWLLPVIMLFWANLHGAFIAGFVTWGLYGLGLAWDVFWHHFTEGNELPERFWRYFLLGGTAALLATLANPVGFKVWATGFGFIGNRYLVGHTAEYLPPNFQDPSTWPFLLMIGLALVLLGVKSKRLEAAQIFPLSAWLVMGLYSVRNVPLFAIVAAPVLADVLSDWLAENYHRLSGLSRFNALDLRLRETDLKLRGFIWPLVILLLVSAGLGSGIKLDSQQVGNRFDPQVFPVQAIDYLAEHPLQGEVFNYFPWGGYILYRMWPSQRVFIDGQTDFYGEQLTRQYEQVLTLAPGWKDVLNQYHVQWALLPPNEPLVTALQDQAGWKITYQDKTAVILQETGKK